MPASLYRAATRIRRRAVTETRCIVCAHWWAPVRQAVTCSLACRTALRRLEAKGERPPFRESLKKALTGSIR